MQYKNLRERMEGEMKKIQDKLDEEDPPEDYQLTEEDVKEEEDLLRWGATVRRVFNLLILIVVVITIGFVIRSLV